MWRTHATTEPLEGVKQKQVNLSRDVLRESDS